MVKVYGKCDSEKELLEVLKGKFKRIEIDSLENFNEFSNYPDKWKREIIEKDQEEINNVEDKIRKKESEKYSAKQEIPYLNNQISKKVNTIKKLRYKGKLKDKIQNEIDSLKNEKRWFEDKLLDLNHEIESLKENKKTLHKRKSENYMNIENDIKRLYELKKDVSFLKKLKGAWGEKEVVAVIERSFKNESKYHLINAFDIDVMDRAISFKDKIQTKNKIDHILICPKGFFILETKAWKNYYDRGIQEINDQLEKSKQILYKVFDDEIKKVLKFVAVSTTRQIELNSEYDFYSVKLENLKSFIDKQDDIIEGGDINIILDKI